MLRPLALKASSTIGVVAPASPVRREFLERGRQEIEALGFRVRLSDRLFEATRYTAGSAHARVEALLELWDDPEVDAVFCARGGYGSLQMLEHIEASRLIDRPKIFLGSSDITALLMFLVAKAGLVCFHGPMVAQQLARGQAAYHRESLEGMLGRSEPWGLLRAPGARVLHTGEGEGVLLGGCLSIVVAMVGTPFLPNFEDSILILEDTNVKPYQIDRMLTQLRLAGCLDGIRGLVFGEMPGCEQHPDQGYTTEELLRDLTADLGVPVQSGFPTGHTVSAAWTLPIGVRARLNDRGLSLLEGAVT